MARPNPKITQHHSEHFLSQHTFSYVKIRHQEMQYRPGPVGVLEILRQREKLPNRVAKSIVGAKKRIMEGQAFVRHGLQTVQPDEDELATIEAEGDRAREGSRQEP